MDDSGAIHGPWCGSRTYPTRCRDCGADVFYFSCNCGCKVFFDRLGWPWPIHDCAEHWAKQRQIRLQEEYARRLEEQRERRQRRDAPIIACPPCDGDIVEELGVIREVVPAIDVYKRFKLSSDSPVARGLLGTLARNEVVQVTIYTGDLSQDALHSYTFFLDRKAWAKLGAVRGDLLSFTVVGRPVPGRSPYWLCTAIGRPELL